MNRNIFHIWKNITLDNKLNFYKNTKKTTKELTIFEPDLCCNYSFEKPNNLKEIYNTWDVFIDWSINDGNSHIAFTINIPKNSEEREEFKDILKLHPIGLDSKKYEKYEMLRDSYSCDDSWIYTYLLKISNINKLVTWRFLITEENKEGVLHFHGIIAYRNIIDYNKNIINNISNKLKKIWSDCDIILKPLNGFKNIKKWIQYLHNNKIWVFPPDLRIIEKYWESKQMLAFAKPYTDNYNLKNNHKINKDHCLYVDYWCISFTVLDCLNQQPTMYLNFEGIKINKNIIDENIFIDLILNYLKLKNYFIYNNEIYSKIENTLISYTKIGSIKELLFDQFENNVILFFVEHFPCQFDGFDFYFLIKNYKNQMENNILKIKNLSTNKITLNFSFLEFTDGIYDVENNNFILKNEFISTFDIHTIKYYKKAYGWVRQNKPKIWIKGITNALGKNNINDFITICLFIASLFRPKNDNIKKKFMYIHGKTNTGKTTYLTKVLTRYFGLENIGSVTNSADFKFQDLQNKLLVIMDEFRYSSNFSSDFLKLLGGEPLLTNQKYAKDHITIQGLMGLILSNYLFFEKDNNTNQALLERLHVIEFLFNVDKTLNNINDINQALADEESNIIVFCNKIYFSYFNKKSNYKNILKAINTTVTRKQKTIGLNNVIKKDFFVKYSETSKWRCKSSNLLKHGDNKCFKIKFIDHYCSKFIITDDNYNREYKYNYLTLNTDIKEIKTSEIVGKVFHNNEWKDQLMNYNYQTFTTDKTDQFFKKTIKPKELEKANELHELLIRSDKIPIIEEKLTKGLEFFNNCIKYSEKFSNCYQTLMISYGENAEIIAKILFHNYII